ncbi:MAG: MFS transporter, partial [Alphaproteobacteria bacterium]|nr:MFS transporter [Alphaproteobacteria bacterium]
MNKRRSIFLSAISGNVLEYYDFTVYAVFSLAIGQAFFPSGSQVIQTLSSLSVFAVGFIMRPIGGIIFGFIADKYGRRVSLIISMLGMTMTTFTIGLIPGYSDIGYGAPILLVMMRLIQGLCISGEGAGAAIFILEHYQNLRPGFTAGIVHASNIAGTLLASFVGIILEQLFPELEFAWRFAFILGGIMGIIGFYFRLRVSETPIFEMLAEKKRTLKMPFMHVIRSSWPAMLITCCLGGSASSLVYIIKTYINIFYYEVLGFDKTTALIYLSYSSVIMMLTMPLSGYISDHIGRFKMIIIASITIVIAATPAFMLLASLEIWKQIVALTTIAMLGGFIAGTAYIFIISLFSAEERFTGVAFSYNLGVALFGGTSAVISRWLVEVTHLYHAPAFYVMIT